MMERAFFAGFGWQIFPILNQDNVAQVFFTAGFEQRVVMVGRDNGNNQIGLAGILLRLE